MDRTRAATREGHVLGALAQSGVHDGAFGDQTEHARTIGASGALSNSAACATDNTFVYRVLRPTAQIFAALGQKALRLRELNLGSVSNVCTESA